MIHDHAPFSPFAAGFPSDPSPAANRPLPDDNQNTTHPAGVTPFITLPRLLTRNRCLDARGGRHGGAAGISTAAAPRPQADGIEHAAQLAVLDMRRQQVEQHGHTAEKDDAGDLFELTKYAGRHLRAMNEYASLGRIEGCRLYAVKLSAHALAVAESCDRRMAHLATITTGLGHG